MTTDEEARELDLIRHAAMEASVHLTRLYNTLAPKAFGPSDDV